MRVFLSWSKPQSKLVATALREWLPMVVQSCEPWMSEADIEAGQRWSTEIEQHLDAASVGVICVTPENYTQPWLNFEAGAISKKLGTGSGTRVAPYLLGFPRVEELPPPLGMFQCKLADVKGTLELVQMVNRAQERPVAEPALEQLFKAMWPTLEPKLKDAQQSGAQIQAVPKRSLEEKVDEMLELARGLLRSSMPAPASHLRENVDTPELHTIPVSTYFQQVLGDIKAALAKGDLPCAEKRWAEADRIVQHFRQTDSSWLFVTQLMANLKKSRAAIDEAREKYQNRLAIEEDGPTEKHGSD